MSNDDMLKRKTYAQFANWKRVSNGRTAAFVGGARRIGKSTVVEEFARLEYADYLLLDFAKESEDVGRLFTESVGDLDEPFRNLFLLKEKTLPKGESVIIFDEVQLFSLSAAGDKGSCGRWALSLHRDRVFAVD